jgi:hypothetical protein
MLGSFNRRRFLAQSFAAIPLPKIWPGLGPDTVRNSRVQQALVVRTQAAISQSKRPIAPVNSNGDEKSLPARIGCYTKGLPQNKFGEVQPAAYDAYLAALKSGNFADFENLPRSGGRKLSNPQSSYTFHMEGGDSHTFSCPPPPSIASKDCFLDSSELYWQSLCRDIPFDQYQTSPIIRKAADHLGFTPASVFRGPTKGDQEGPYISQFLYKPIPFGSGTIVQRYNVPIAGSDFMTTVNEWSQMQAAFLPWRAVSYDPIPRYIRNGRDLAEYVHYDFAYQAHLCAALILVNANAKSILNCNQFKSGNNPYHNSTNEEGFVTFGPAEAADWIGRATTAALKAAYYQKWMIHRRVRPEALGGLIHLTRAGVRKYPIHESLFNPAVDAVHEHTGSYLLPQAYPEGCPLHPSYPSGHATIAGACAVMLKASFDGSMLLPSCVQPDKDGTALIPCPDFSPTINSEIDKLAFNIAMGRDWAGIHYRSDSLAGLQLGEEVGISILQDIVRTYSERFDGLAINRFDGTRIRISSQGEVISEQ